MGSRACEGFESFYEELGGSLALQKFHLSHLGVDVQSNTTVGMPWASLRSMQYFLVKSYCPKKKGGTPFLQRALGVLGGNKGLINIIA